MRPLSNPTLYIKLIISFRQSHITQHSPINQHVKVHQNTLEKDLLSEQCVPIAQYVQDEHNIPIALDVQLLKRFQVNLM